MAAQPDPADLNQAATTPDVQQTGAPQERTQPPLNRRRALRVLSALAATAGAAALAAARPKEALADADVSVTNGSTANFGIYAAPTGTARPNVNTGVRGVLGTTVTNANFTLPTQAGVQGATAGQIGVAGTGSDQAVAVEGIVAAEDASVNFNNTSAAVLGTSSTRSGVVGASTVVHGIVGQTAATQNAVVPNDGFNHGAGVLPCGVFGIATTVGIGVGGLSTSGTSGFGVVGTTVGAGTAVAGQSLGGGIGVAGNSSGTAVFGNSSGGGIGVSGQTTSSDSAHPAVQGLNLGAGPGVVGFSGTGTGVGGGSGSGIGFGGVSSSGSGVQGQSTTGPAIVGVINVASNGTNYSGHFIGGAGVLINGSLTQMNGSKSAAVRHTDGTLRRLYCVESPESWFEDFGHGQLSNGSATVQIESGFAGVVKTDDYHVFLTPRGEPKGPLYVSNVTPAGFSVHEAGGTSTIAFDYRVVAKRKDIEGARLERVEEPPAVELITLPEPTPTPATQQTLPALPALPVQPAPSSPGRRG
jgi:hypothetical protein